MTLLKSQAIQTALLGDWNEAVSLNQQLLKADPNDIEALNRLAFAYAAMGKTKHAKTTYQKVLRLDSQNPIAIKNLKRLLGTGAWSSIQTARTVDSMFLEESGKTKVIDLVNIAEAKVIALLITGELVNLTIKRLKIFVLDPKLRYIGMLPDNIGKHLIKFMKGGNTYQAYVKAVSNNKVSIFIRETRKMTKFKDQPSFVSDRSQLQLDRDRFKTKNNEEKDQDVDDESL